MRRDPATDTLDFYSLARGYLHDYMTKARRLSPKTVQAYRISLECFLEYLAEAEDVDRTEITFEQFDRPRLKGWLAWMTEQRHYAPHTVALRLSAVKAFLAYCSQEDITLLALSQSAKTLKPPASPRMPIEYLTEPQTRAVLAAFTGATAKSRRNRMLLILLYDTAARVSEITDLTLQDLHLTLPGHLTVTGKRNKTRTIPIANPTIEHLKVYLAEFHPGLATLPATRPVFYSLHHNQPTALSTDTVASLLKTAAETARTVCPSVPATIHCHMLRKTKAMDLYQQGIPLPIIMRLLGHESTTTTSTFYAFATLDMMRKAVNAATPAAISATLTQPLTDDTLHTLCSLR